MLFRQEGGTRNVPGAGGNVSLIGGSRCKIPQGSPVRAAVARVGAEESDSWRACEESYSLFSICPSRSGAFRTDDSPGRHQSRAPKGDEELAEGVQEDPQATKEVAKEEHEIANEGDQELEEAALVRPLIASLHASLSATRREAAVWPCCPCAPCSRVDR